jgi:hypothetical protein
MSILSGDIGWRYCKGHSLRQEECSRVPDRVLQQMQMDLVMLPQCRGMFCTYHLSLPSPPLASFIDTPLAISMGILRSQLSVHSLTITVHSYFD